MFYNKLIMLKQKSMDNEENSEQVWSDNSGLSTSANKMRKGKGNEVLFLDNTASHLNNLQCTNEKLLPINTTSVCKPLDQGIIKKIHLKFTIDAGCWDVC